MNKAWVWRQGIDVGRNSAGREMAWRAKDREWVLVDDGRVGGQGMGWEPNLQFSRKLRWSRNGMAGEGSGTGLV